MSKLHNLNMRPPYHLIGEAFSLKNGDDTERFSTAPCVYAVLYLLPKTVEFYLQGLQETSSLTELTLGTTQSLVAFLDL